MNPLLRALRVCPNERVRQADWGTSRPRRLASEFVPACLLFLIMGIQSGKTSQTLDEGRGTRIRERDEQEEAVTPQCRSLAFITSLDCKN
jgi:hypothetical protein